MKDITFSNLAYYLRQGREIEFSYKGRCYSITNHSGFWYLCDDTHHILLETLCPFAERDTLVSKIAASVLSGLTISEIFDRQLYDSEALHIL